MYKMVRKHPDMYQTKEQVMTVVTALAGNLEISEKVKCFSFVNTVMWG